MLLCRLHNRYFMSLHHSGHRGDKPNCRRINDNNIQYPGECRAGIPVKMKSGVGHRDFEKLTAQMSSTVIGVGANTRPAAQRCDRGLSNR